jgi:hypothetical protein
VTGCTDTIGISGFWTEGSEAYANRQEKTVAMEQGQLNWSANFICGIADEAAVLDMKASLARRRSRLKPGRSPDGDQ